MHSFLHLSQGIDKPLAVLAYFGLGRLSRFGGVGPPFAESRVVWSVGGAYCWCCPQSIVGEIHGLRRSSSLPLFLWARRCSLARRAAGNHLASIAARRRFWFDEFFTFLPVRLDLTAFFAAMAAGAPVNFPLYHLLIQASHSILGPTHFATRLPSILGFLLMQVSIFYIARRRVGALYAVLAMLFPAVTGALYYATEARAYALPMGLESVALFCWLWAAEHERRGVAVTLALSVNLSFQTVLLCFPFGLGELTRTWQRRRLDVPVWIAFAASALPLPFFLPYLRAVKAQQGPGVFAKPDWNGTVAEYLLFLKPALWVGFAAFVAVIVWSAARTSETPDRERVPFYENVAIMGLVALPFFGYGLGRLVTGISLMRYAMPAVIGCGLALAFVLERQTKRSATAGLLVLMTMLFSLAYALRVQLLSKDSVRVPYNASKWMGEELPVAVQDPNSFIKLHFYSPEPYASRLFYLDSPAGAMHWLETDTPERNLLGLQGIVPINVVSYDAFVKPGRRFLLYRTAPSTFGWVSSQLLADGARMQLVKDISLDPDQMLFMVEMPQEPRQR
jgi:hypothetical protein